MTATVLERDHQNMHYITAISLHVILSPTFFQTLLFSVKQKREA